MLSKPSLLVALAWFPAVALSVAHGVGIWLALGGWQEIVSPWPLYLNDHAHHFHCAMVTRSMFPISGTNAGYDPSFMAGYAKSLYSNPSSNLSDLVVGLLGAGNPVLAYRVYVFFVGMAVPWLVIGAGRLLRFGPGATGAAVGLFVVDLWSGFGLGYLFFGMVAFFLSVPLGLLATLAVVNFLDCGGFGRWLLSAILLSLLWLVHVTSPMLVVPAVACSYAAAVVRARRVEGASFPASRHAGVWSLVLPVLVVNAFWWLPAACLASTTGPSEFAFRHPEPIWDRFLSIATVESPAMSILAVLMPVGLAVLARQRLVAAVGLATYAAAGFFWGYLAGAFRIFDFLQPGRQAFAFYTGCALAGGIAVAELARRLRSVSPDRLDLWAYAAVLLIVARIQGPMLGYELKEKFGGPTPFLMNRANSQLRWVVENVKRHVPRGSRLFYEEGGVDLPNVSDPFRSGRFSGLLPTLAGVEVVGGPFLRMALKTNFTQLGEGRLFGKRDWDRARFERYARLYRPSAILCWTPPGRSFCERHADLIEILEDNGVFILGRVKGFEGPAIEGSAEVVASPGRLVVNGLRPGPDGSVVLAYHAMPRMRTDPPVPWDSVLLEDDPVPFIRLRPPIDTVKMEIHFPPFGDRKLKAD